VGPTAGLDAVEKEQSNVFSEQPKKSKKLFLISNFRRVVNVIFFF